jgi:hypothetical protein
MRLRSDTLNTLLLLGLAAGVYWLWKRFPSMADVSRAGATAYNLLTTPTVSSQFLSSVALPDGSVLPVSAILDAGSMIDGQGFFTWQGSEYQVTGRDPDLGYYLTKRIVT